MIPLLACQCQCSLAQCKIAHSAYELATAKKKEADLQLAQVLRMTTRVAFNAPHTTRA